MTMQLKSVLIPVRGSLWTGGVKPDSHSKITQALNTEALAGWRLHSQAFIPPSVWSGSVTGNLSSYLKEKFKNFTMNLAQLNIGRIVAPLDSPQLAEFVARLETVNGQAESAPGFVWRLKDDGAGATSIRMFDDDLLLVNMSVWSNPQTLHDFVYKQKDHADALRMRREWFEQLSEVMVVCWKVPEDHFPSVAEAREKLLLLREKGSSKEAFTLKDAPKYFG